MRMLSRWMTLAVLTGLLIVPISEARTRVYLRVGPPPIIVERPTLAPRAGYIWQPGYHRWDGRAYVWNAGMWAAPPYPHARWIPGHWVETRRGFYWAEGHWRRYY